MERSCALAVELGLPSVAFTEDADHTVWTRAALSSHDKCDRSAGPCEHMLQGGGCGLEGEAIT